MKFSLFIYTFLPISVTWNEIGGCHQLMSASPTLLELLPFSPIWKTKLHQLAMWVAGMSYLLLFMFRFGFCYVFRLIVMSCMSCHYSCLLGALLWSSQWTGLPGLQTENCSTQHFICLQEEVQVWWPRRPEDPAWDVIFWTAVEGRM